MYPELIVKRAKELDPTHDNEIPLYILVLLHELAHAMMSSTFDVKNSDIVYPYPKFILPKGMKDNKDKYYHLIEESLANMMALQMFADYYGENSDEYKFALEFVRAKQPMEYKFGKVMYDINADWRKWRLAKHNGSQLKQSSLDKLYDAAENYKENKEVDIEKVKEAYNSLFTE